MNDWWDYISHSGILGMKWGRRRYQNPDGSLTPEGREHYGIGPARKKGSENRVTVRMTRSNSAKTETQLTSKEKAKVPTKAEIISSGNYKTVMKYKDQLTTDELRRALDRIRLESELTKFAPPEKVSRGKKLANDIVSKIGNKIVEGVGDGSKATASAVAKYGYKKLLTEMLGSEVGNLVIKEGNKKDKDKDKDKD